MPTDPNHAPSPDASRRLVEFARAFKAAAKAVVLYPASHPGVAATVGRLVDLTSVASLPAPLRMAVLPDTLVPDATEPIRADASITELAQLLHHHLIGQITVHPGGDAAAWQQFLVLLGRAPDEVRGEGGVALLWNRMQGRHIELREIDYAEVLRERGTAKASNWADVVARCLKGELPVHDQQMRRFILKAAGNLEELKSLVAALDTEAAAGGDERARAASIIRLFDGIAEAATAATGTVDPMVLGNLATTFALLSPEMMKAVLTQPAPTETPGLIRSVVSHVSDESAAGFVARHAMAAGTSTERLAQVFQTLVPEERRQRLVSLAKKEALSTAATTHGFEERWEAVAETLLTSYSDKPFISEAYAGELNRTRDAATHVERVSDDPPERINAWLQSVAPSELRRLDLALLHDLLASDIDAGDWKALMRPVVALIDDLMLGGDFEAVEDPIRALLEQRERAGSRAQAAADALDALVAGPLIRRVIGPLATVDDTQFGCLKRILLALGDPVVTPLAEALLDAPQLRTRDRLTALLVAFGPRGRREVERLRRSSHASVRRTAVDLLSEFGGSETLPELTGFLRDSAPEVQRHAARAILAFGTDRAFAVLGQALTEGTPAQQEAIITAITSSRRQRSAPVFTYILRKVGHRGPATALYVRAINALGALKDAEAIQPLQQALQRGDWWAPRRTKTLRDASAAALARIGTREAFSVLQQAATSGSRGVRAAARPCLAPLPALNGSDQRR